MPFEPWQPGMIVTEERLASISPTWQDWAPGWSTSSGTATPSYGDAIVTAQYATSADTCWFWFEIVFGAGTNFGGGGGGDNWLFTLPVAARANVAVYGWAELNASTNERVVSRVRNFSTDRFQLEISSGRPDAAAITNLGVVDAISPWPWASGDASRGTGHYPLP
jgi:hypothetical protein